MVPDKALFKNEEQLLDQYRELEDGRNVSTQDYSKLFSAVVTSYADLLEQARFITKISDRLEKKLDVVNQSLNIRNSQLQTAIAELTKARIGKTARAIVYSIAVGLFVLEELFVEPVISLFGDGMILGFLLKLLLVLLLKPAESFLESILIKRSLNLKNQNVLSKLDRGH